MTIDKKCLPHAAQRIRFFLHDYPTWPQLGIYHSGRFHSGFGSSSIAEVCAWEPVPAHQAEPVKPAAGCSHPCRQSGGCQSHAQAAPSVAPAPRADSAGEGYPLPLWPAGDERAAVEQPSGRVDLDRLERSALVSVLLASSLVSVLSVCGAAGYALERWPDLTRWLV